MGLATISNGVESWLEEVSVDRSATKAVTASEAKNFAKSDNQPSSEDAIFDMLINASQQAFEVYCHSFLFEATVTATYSFGRGGATSFFMPYGPVTDIIDVDADYTQHGNWIELGTHNGDNVTVEYKCKLFDNAGDVDGKIKIGLLKWIATNYNDRENTIVDDINEMPNGSKAMWKSYRYMIA